MGGGCHHCQDLWSSSGLFGEVPEKRHGLQFGLPRCSGKNTVSIGCCWEQHHQPGWMIKGTGPPAPSPAGWEFLAREGPRAAPVPGVSPSAAEPGTTVPPARSETVLETGNFPKHVVSTLFSSWCVSSVLEEQLNPVGNICSPKPPCSGRRGCMARSNTQKFSRLQQEDTKPAPDRAARSVLAPSAAWTSLKPQSCRCDRLWRWLGQPQTCSGVSLLPSLHGITGTVHPGHPRGEKSRWGFTSPGAAHPCMAIWCKPAPSQAPCLLPRGTLKNP